MRIFSYRNKTRLKSGLVVLLVLAAALLLLVSGIFIYLQRFIVYSADGVHLDFSSRPDAPDSMSPDPDGQNWVLENASGTNGVNLEIQDNVPSPGRTQLTGVYITTAMLSDPAAVEAALFQEECPKTVLMDMKSIFGNFYYATSFPGATTASADLEAVASIVSQLKRSDAYLIARIPAFSDNTFALANQDCGLALSSGALWMDSNGCYWLNPADDLVVYYLESIAKELYALGFDEVVFDGFEFPVSDSIVYPSGFSKEETLGACAVQLQQALADTGILLSFGTQEPLVVPSAYRIYLTSSDGSEVADLTAAISGVLDDPSTQIVFLTTSRDTRFQAYGVLLPLIEPQ